MSTYIPRDSEVTFTRQTGVAVSFTDATILQLAIDRSPLLNIMDECRHRLPLSGVRRNARPLLPNGISFLILRIP